MSEIVRTPNGHFAPGHSANPGGKRGGKGPTAGDYDRALREAITVEDYVAAGLKVLEMVKQTGSIKGFIALSDRLAGKPRIVEDATSEQGLEKFRELLAEVREQRRQWEAAESGATIIDVTPKVTQ